MIFYAIYKKQPKHFYYWSFQLQGVPQKELQFRNVVPGRTGRRGSAELSHSGGGFGRGWVGKVEGLTIDRFVAVDGWEIAGARPAGGAQAAWPRCGSVRRCSGLEDGCGGAGEVGEP
jgi:hypothetical protein